MKYLKLSLWLAVTLTFTAASRQGEKLTFQESPELIAMDKDQRPANSGHGNRNNRGRGHRKDLKVPEFEEGLPGIYPIRGPPPAPVVLPSHPGKAVGLQRHNQNVPTTQQPPLPTTNTLPAYHFEINNYANHPAFSKQRQQEQLQQLPHSSVIPNNKYNPTTTQGVTNQLPTSDKPISTTTYNPRRTDLMYGSNLQEEAKDREGKSSTPGEPEFGDRGLFDTAPHCQSNQILVNNKCRLAV